MVGVLCHKRIKNVAQLFLTKQKKKNTSKVQTKSGADKWKKRVIKMDTKEKGNTKLF